MSDEPPGKRRRSESHHSAKRRRVSPPPEPEPTETLPARAEHPALWGAGEVGGAGEAGGAGEGGGAGEIQPPPQPTQRQTRAALRRRRSVLGLDRHRRSLTRAASIGRVPSIGYDFSNAPQTGEEALLALSASQQNILLAAELPFAPELLIGSEQLNAPHQPSVTEQPSGPEQLSAPDHLSAPEQLRAPEQLPDSKELITLFPVQQRVLYRRQSLTATISREDQLEGIVPLRHRSETHLSSSWIPDSSTEIDPANIPIPPVPQEPQHEPQQPQYEPQHEPQQPQYEPQQEPQQPQYEPQQPQQQQVPYEVPPLAGAQPQQPPELQFVPPEQTQSQQPHGWQFIPPEQTQPQQPQGLQFIPPEQTQPQQPQGWQFVPPEQTQPDQPQQPQGWQFVPPEQTQPQQPQGWQFVPPEQTHPQQPQGWQFVPPQQTQPQQPQGWQVPPEQTQPQQPQEWQFVLPEQTQPQQPQGWQFLSLEQTQPQQSADWQDIPVEYMQTDESTSVQNVPPEFMQPTPMSCNVTPRSEEAMDTDPPLCERLLDLYGFGAQAPNTNPFAQNQLFNKAAGTAATFGNPQPSTFGQPAGSSLFPGQQQQTGIFQNANTSTFGAPAAGQAGFGNTNLFGQQQPQPSTSGLFGSTSFGAPAKQVSFGFGSPAQQSGIFGQQQAQAQPQGSSLFQPSGSANIFGQTSTFGGPAAQTGTVVKFNPVTGTDTMQKGGVPTSISTKHHCITCMKEYEGKSLEELRYEDYIANRKGPQQQPGFGAPPFGAPASSAPSLFGQTDNKPAFGQQTAGFGQPTSTFGQATTGFGMPNQQAAPSSLFSKPATGFGTPATGSTFGFGTATNTAQPFGGPPQAKPFGATPQPLFGATAAQPTGFGTGLFGPTANQPAAGTGLFGKSAPTAGFSTGQTSGFSFSQPTTTTSSLFQTPKPATGFGLFGQTSAPNTGFSQTNTFGQPSTFGTGTFGKPGGQTFTPGNQPFAAPSFIGLQPQSGSLFASSAPKPGGLFGTVGNTGGLFTNSSFQAPPGFNNLGQQHQQFMQFPTAQQQEAPLSEISSSPFPISPHLQSLIPVSRTDPANYATNRNELQAIIDSTRIQESSPKLKMRPISRERDRAFSLFDGLDDEQTVLYDQITTRRPKCLVIKPKPNQRRDSDSEEELYALVREVELAQRGAAASEAQREPENIPSERSKSSTASTDRPSQTGDVQSTSSSTTRTTAGDTASSGRPQMASTSRSLQVPEEQEPAADEYVTPQGSPQRGRVLSPSPRPSISRRESSQSPPRASLRTVRDFSTFTASTSTPISVARTSDRGGEGAPASTSESRTYRCGVVCTRPDYYTVPSPEELDKYVNDDGTCIIKGFTIGRVGYGNVYFPDSIDVSNLNIDEVIFIRNKEITLYPKEEDKPPIGQGLNRKAQVTLDHIYPKNDEDRDVRVLDEVLQLVFKDFLQEQSVKQGTKFLEYRPETGSWVFQVAHFSKYGLVDEPPKDHELQKIADRLRKKIHGRQMPSETQGASSDGKMDHEGHEYGSLEGGGLGGAEDITSVLDLSTKVHQEATDPQREMEAMRYALYGSQEDLTIQHHIPVEEYDYLNTIMDVVDDQILTAQTFSPHLSPRRGPMYSYPSISVLQNIGGVVPPEHSMVTGLRCYADLALFKGKSYKCGFDKGFKHLTIGNEVLTGRYACSTVIVKDIFRNKESRYILENLTDALDIVHNEAECTFDENEIPTYKVVNGISLLAKQMELFTRLSSESVNDEYAKYISSIWELCSAFWTPLQDSNDLRRDCLSDWLKKTVDMSVIGAWELKCPGLLSYSEVTKATLDLLSINKTRDAAQLLMTYNFPELSMLVSQLTATENLRSFLQEQVAFWYTCLMEEFVTVEMKKIYLLLSGNIFYQDANVCEGLDWKRAFGMHLWYSAPGHAPIQEAIRIYNDAFDCEGSYTVPPYPPYAKDRTNFTSYDILYHIMLLYCERVYVLNHVLDPSTYSSDPLDYSMSWLLLQVFTTLQVGVIDKMSETMIAVSFANQLESMDLWEYAIMVLLFIKDKSIKKKHVIEILERNLSSDVTPDDNKIASILIKKIKVPSQWVYEVLAWKSHLARNYWNTYVYFAYAGDYYKSNDIFIEHIMPDLVINKQFEQFQEAVKPLEPYSERITTWSSEIGLILDYLKLEEQYEGTKTQDEIMRLYTTLLRFVERLPHFPVKTSSQKACVAEISKACATFQRFLVSQAEDPAFLHNFQYIVKSLVMPPDYIMVEALHYLLKLMDFELTQLELSKQT